MKIRNWTGPRTLPWGLSSLNRRGDEWILLRHTLAARVEEVSKPCVELTLDAIGREFVEKGGMLDCIRSMRYVQQRDGPNLSDIEGVHPLLGIRSSMSNVE